MPRQRRRRGRARTRGAARRSLREGGFGAPRAAREAEATTTVTYRTLAEPDLLAKKYASRWMSRALGRPLPGWPLWAALVASEAVDSDTLKRQHLERLRASVRGAELAGEGRVLRGLRYWESRWLKLPNWSRSGCERGVTPEERRAILDEAREANQRLLAHQAFDWAKGRLFLEEEMDKDAGASGRRGLLQRFRSSLRRTASSRGRSRSREDGVDRVDSVGVSARRGLGGGVGQAFSGDDDELDPGNNRPPNASRFGRRGRPAATDIEEGGGSGIRGGVREGLLSRRRKGESRDGSSSSSDDEEDAGSRTVTVEIESDPSKREE